MIHLYKNTDSAAPMHLMCLLKDVIDSKLQGFAWEIKTVCIRDLQLPKVCKVHKIA